MTIEGDAEASLSLTTTMNVLIVLRVISLHNANFAVVDRFSRAFAGPQKKWVASCKCNSTFTDCDCANIIHI